MHCVTAYAMLIRFLSLVSFCWQIWLAGNKHFTRHIYRQTVKGGGALGFSVLQFWSLLRSVFFGFCTQKKPGFSVLVSTAVFGFSLFDIRVSVFMNKKAVIRFLPANWRIVRTFLSLSRVTKVSPSYEMETIEEAIALVEHCKNFLRDNAHLIRAASSITGALNGP